MKRKIYVILFLTLLFVLLVSTKSYGYFRIENFEINCYVQENGDMKVEENITYNTNEYRNGITRDIELKNKTNTINSANGFVLQSVKVDGISYQKTNSGKNGDSGVYEYTNSGNTHSLKVYTPFKNNGKTVTYTYLLKDVAVSYQDTAEVFWNFIGSKWDTDILNVGINITLPEEAKNSNIFVFGHGSDNGTFTKNGNYISLNAKQLKAYQALDARILFSNEAITQSNKKVYQKVLQKYINQEEGMSKNREEKEIIFGLSVNEIGLLLSIVIVVAGIIIYFTNNKKVKIEKQHYVRDIPSNLEPELLQTIYYGKICNDAFWITFLNLVKLGVYRIEKTVNEVGKETQKIVFVKRVDGLKPHQEKVISTINEFMNGNSIDLMSLKSKFKRSSNSGFSRFKNALTARKEELFGETKKASMVVKTILNISMAVLILLICYIASINGDDPEMSLGILMFFGITTIVYSIMFVNVKMNLYTAMFFFVHCGMFQMANLFMLVSEGVQALYIPYVLLFGLIQIVYRIKVYSKEELQLKEQIRGLRNYIKDYSMLEDRGIEHIALWEDYLILAIALKLNNKTINYFYDYCKNNINTDFGQSLVCIGTYSVMASSFKSTFNAYQATSTSYSSSGSSFSGSSGGFSGGSSSGGGGRRRWRR